MPEHFLDKKLVNLGNRLFEAFRLPGIGCRGWYLLSDQTPARALSYPHRGNYLDARLGDRHQDHVGRAYDNANRAILILCIAVLVLRIGSTRFGESDSKDT